MSRRLLKTEILLAKMNRELVRFDTCIECRFKSIVPLNGIDEHGCNWSHANLTCKGYPTAAGQPPDICQPFTVCHPMTDNVITSAKNKYNVR